MRELKFRAWYPAYNKMYYNLMVGELASGAGTVPVLLNSEGERVNLWGDNSQGTIMQFTGLQDKNGKDIYEGDLCNIDGEIHEVYWNEDRWGLQDATIKPGSGLKFDYNNGSDYNPNEIMWDTCEVVGNMHENTDLFQKAGS